MGPERGRCGPAGRRASPSRGLLLYHTLKVLLEVLAIDLAIVFNERNIRVPRQGMLAELDEGAAFDRHGIFIDGIEVEDIVREHDHKLGVGGVLPREMEIGVDHMI